MNTVISKEPLSSVIERRYSCRTYNGSLLEQTHLDELGALINELEQGPFGSRSRFTVVASRAGDAEALKGLGTYGMIKRPAGFIIGAMGAGPMRHEDFGYRLELLVLGATALGVDTCWLGGSFTGSTFARRMGLHDHETLPAVIALGYRAESMRAFERIARWKTGADDRKAWNELFFDGTPGRALTSDRAGSFAPALELLRRAPSAVNYQPWRVIMNEARDSFGFYLARNPRYGEKSFMIKSDIQRIDMGIAMAHFDMALREAGIKGAWHREETAAVPRHAGWEYIASWTG